MARIIVTTATFLSIALFSSLASAGVYTDDLTKCLVKSSDSGDQAILVQWIFASLALNPAVQPYTNVTKEQRDTLNQKLAGLYQRLVFTDCHKETVEALKYEGSGALEAAFQVLGQVAARGLMSDPNVAAGMQGFAAYTDKDKWNALAKEAGIAAPSPATVTPTK